MKTTYDDILCAMKNAFYEKSGENPEKYSELSLRFEAAASEMYSLFCRSEFVLKQAFPQTASGEYLDFHAELRGIKRKKASPARTALTFYIGEAKQSDTVIEKGCICSSGENPYIQFATEEDLTIPAGGLSASVAASATVSGSCCNVKKGEITVIVNPPLSVERVENGDMLEYGFDSEGDESLRRRVLSSYGVPSTGFSLNSVKEAILGIDEVLDCRVSKTGSRLIAAVKTKKSTLDDELKEKISERMFFADAAEMQKEISLAKRKSCSLLVDVKCSAGEFERIKSGVEKKIKDLTADGPVGEPFRLSLAVYSVSGIDGISYCEAASPDAVQGIIPCAADEYLCFDEIEVTCHE